MMNVAMDDTLGALHERPTEDEMDEFPLDDECTASLTLKCGSPSLASRKKLHDEIPVHFVPRDGFAAFQSQVEKNFITIGPTYVQDTRAIYLKPSTNATQSKYLLLTKDNFVPALRMRWKVARSMKSDPKQLTYELFCYFDDTTRKRSKSRGNKSFKQDMAPEGMSPADVATMGAPGGVNAGGVGANAFMGFGANPGGFPMGAPQGLPAGMQGYTDVAASIVESSGVTGKRPVGRPSGSGANGSADAGARKVARSNRMASPHMGGNGVPEDTQFVALPVRINGAVLPLEVDLTALRRALGLTGAARPTADATAAAQRRR